MRGLLIAESDRAWKAGSKGAGSRGAGSEKVEEVVPDCGAGDGCLSGPPGSFYQRVRKAEAASVGVRRVAHLVRRALAETES